MWCGFDNSDIDVKHVHSFHNIERLAPYHYRKCLLALSHDKNLLRHYDGEFTHGW